MKNSYVQLSSEIVSKLHTALESFTYPCWFYQWDHSYTGCNTAAENYGDIPEDLSLCPDSLYRTCKCSNAGETFCTIVILRDTPSWAEGFILTLFREILNGKEYSDLQTLRKLRSFYVGQLANLETPTADLKAFLHTTSYASNYPRAAVLVSFADTMVQTSTIYDNIGSPSAILSLGVEQSSFFDIEDIFGALGYDLFLDFKAVSGETPEEKIDYLKDIAGKLSEMCLKQFSMAPVITIGSVYTSINELHQSYDEAFFLLQNAHILKTNKETESNILIIQDYLAEYLAGQYLSSQPDILFRDYHKFFDSHPLENELLGPMLFSNMNMIRAGEILDIHRNTVLQRYHKIESGTELSPKSNISDRLFLRSYFLNSRKSVVLHTGVHIQEQSVQYRGLRHLAELIKEKSSGTLQLQIGHLSAAGNNTELFHFIEAGSLDIGICGNAALYTLAQDLASLIELPFLFSSVKEAQTILNKVILPVLNHTLHNYNVMCPAFWVIGSRHITSKTPVRTPDDLKGKHIRTMNKGSLYQYFAHIGAVPVVIRYDTLNHAIKTGLVECQENPYVNILGIKLFEVQRYINEMVYYYNISPVFINKTSYNSLSEFHRRILTESVSEATEYLVKEQAKYNNECRTILITEKDMIPVSPAKEEINEWVACAEFLFKNHPLQDVLQDIFRNRTLLRKENHEI